MPPDTEGPVAGFPDAQLDRTLGLSYGVGADTGLPDAVRFLVGTVRAIRNRLRNTIDNPESTPTLFLLTRKGAVAPPEGELQIVHLMDQGRAPLEGRVWFVNAPVLRAEGLRIPDWDSESLITEIAVDWGAGEVPAILFDPTTDQPQIRHYPRGLANSDECDVRHIEDRMVDLDEILTVIDEIHDRFLQTGTAQSRSVKLWEDQDMYYPKRDAEDLVQHHLRLGLTTALLSCIVREEQPSPVGRLDLKIEDREPRGDGGPVPHAILELKVLRSFTSGGTRVSIRKNKEWIASGVKQADSYRKEWSARAAALCCFDMRVAPEGDGMFTKATRKEAAALDVRLRAWDLYPTPAAERSAP